jgi:hypothetical protein
MKFLMMKKKKMIDKETQDQDPNPFLSTYKESGISFLFSLKEFYLSSQVMGLSIPKFIWTNLLPSMASI